jgi:hypothetical protein
MGKPKNLKKQLEKYQAAIPNRAKLSYETMFAATEAERAAAQVLLDLLPKEPRTADERVQWATDLWLNAPTTEALALSPAGRQILEMVGDSKPLPKYDVVKTDAMAVVGPEPAPTEQPIPALQPPQGPSDDLGERMEQERAAKRERERNAPPWKWTELKPSAPDKSLRPLAPSDWNSDSNNDPIY